MAKKKERIERWGIKVRKTLIDRIDEVKWEQRTTRAKLVERMLLLAVVLMEVKEGESTAFDRLEVEFASHF